jgi:hypothetical protein
VGDAGEISLDLPTTEPTSSRDAKTGSLVPSVGNKAETLAAAGISTSTANRVEDRPGFKSTRSPASSAVVVTSPAV